jgi:hypothetical protein
MRFCSPKRLWLALLLLSVAADSARGQWRIVAPNALTPMFTGAIDFSDGILHLSGSESSNYVTSELLNSSDTGKTWFTVNFPSAGITDINFFDRNNGVVSTLGEGLFLTRDGGLTWTNPIPNLEIRCASFNGSPLVIHAIEKKDHTLITTTDGGLTWNSFTLIANEGLCLSVGKDRTVYAFTADDAKPGNTGWVTASSDSGRTWKSPGGGAAGDAYTLASDSCDVERLYLVAEDFYWPYDMNSHIYVSDNGGNSWEQTFIHPLYYLSGSLANGRSIEFVPTLWDGILRSSDNGVTWTNTGGPGNTPDCRGICAVDDNIVFVLDDSSGNIWASFNSGGDSVLAPSLSLSPSALFLNDTVVCDSISRVLLLTRANCFSPSVKNWGLSGSDSASFKVTSFSEDSILVTFYDTVQGARRAQLILSLDNGYSDTVALAGSVNIPPNSLTASPNTLFSSDTISCDSLTRSIVFSRIGCSPPSVSSFSIIGQDSMSFHASNLTEDSILITVYGMKSGNQNAQLVLALDNGSSDTVALAGYVNLPPNILSPFPDTLFASDSISCDSLTHSVLFIRSGCSPPSVSSWSVTSTDSATFRASNLSFDSIEVTLYGMKQGNQNAKLVLNLNNGTNDTVALAGYVNISPSALTLSTQNVQTDTLGATVAVPITLNGLEHAENIELVLHYDGPVDYLGSFSPSGVQLDVPGEQWAGRSELSITGATSGAVMGYAKFNVFNDSNEAAHATFDSVTVLTQTSACEYSMPAPDTSTITTLSGCAIPILSQLIHFGVEPTFSIVPNPTNGNVWISSSGDVGAVTIEVYDMLGTQQSIVSGQINENEPIELQLPGRSGVYNIVVRANSGTRTLRVVREN